MNTTRRFTDDEMRQLTEGTILPNLIGRYRSASLRTSESIKLPLTWRGKLRTFWRRIMKRWRYKEVQIRTVRYIPIARNGNDL